MDLALNNLQWLICHKTQPKQTNKYTWLRKGNLKRKTESFLIAAKIPRHKNQSYQSENR